MAASTYFAQVQQLYIAYFGRPADTVGLAYWAGQIDAANGSIAAVQAGFSASAESTALFGNKSTIDKVTAIYQNAFGRAPEPAGLAYWVAQLDSGKVTQAQASWTIQQSAGAGDAAAVQNKLTAAQAFTAQIDTTAEIQGYQGDAAAASARAFLATVTQSNATATAAVNGAAAALNTAVAASANASGKAFALTTGVDNLVGTTGNDVFNAILVNNEAAAAAATSTLNAFDLVDGGAGTLDKLAITVTGANSSAGALAATLPVTTGVEVLSIKNLSSGTANGVTINASTATGVTQVVNDGSTGAVAVTGVANATVVAQNTNAATTVTFNTGAVAAATTVLNVAVNNAGTAVAPADVILNSAGGAVAATNLAIKADGTSVVNLGAGSAVAAVTTATVTGTGSVDLGSLTALVTKVDSSALLGGLTYTSLATTATTILTGAGNDVITLGANLATGSNITLGAGNDAVKKGGAFTVATGSVIDGGAGVDAFDLALVNVSNAASFVNFEVASLDGLAVATYDLDLLSAKNVIGSLALTTGTNNAVATVTNIASGSTLNVTGGTTTNLTLIEKGAAASATDSLGITFASTVANTASSVATTVNEVETFNVVSGGATGATNSLTLAGGTFSQATSTATAVTEKVVVTGANQLTLGVASSSAFTKITVDGSAATGKLIVTGDSHTTSIITGAGDDTINVGAVANTVVTGAGKDVVNVLAAAGATNITTVTGLAVGDSLTTTVTGGAAGTVAKIGAATALGGATDLTTVLTTLATAADDAASHAAWAVVGSDVYLVLDTAAANGTLLAADNVIKLAGVTDISNYTSNANGLIAVA